MRTKYSEDFEMFWKLYPKRWDRQARFLIKRKKAPAYESWQKLSNEIKAECLMNAKKIKSFEGSSVRDCVTWLNQKGWIEMRPEEVQPTNAQIQEMARDLLKEVPKPINFEEEANKQTRKLRNS